MDPKEIVRMNRMLQVEDLSFKLQLEESVSILYLHCNIFLNLDLDPKFLYPFINLPVLSQGFSDTSLTVGEAATVLLNYER